MKKSRFWLISLLMLVVVFCCTFAVACSGNTDDPNSDDPNQNQENPDTPETPDEGITTEGTYYYDASDGYEYLVTLSEDGTITVVIGTDTWSGTYSLDDDGNFTIEGISVSITATLSDGVITLTYNGSTMTFLKRTEYTVTFESNGGSTVSAVIVVNGRTLAKPADPTYEGYKFLGWYADSTLTEAYDFSTAVTSNITLYARWAAYTEGEAVYTVDFDLNYDGAAELEAATTIGGKVYDVATPERSGYTFCGWWISMYDSADKLSFMYTEGYVFSEDTTLFALWAENTTSSKLATPVVNIVSNTISWDDVSTGNNVLRYNVVVTDAEGNEIYNQNVNSTTVDLSSVIGTTGEYIISVVAESSTSSDNNSDACVRYYATNMLSRVSVSQIEVTGNVLTYNSIANAEEYYITIDCGNEKHEHTLLSNGSSLYYDFSNCEMQKEGISFTITAAADGYVSSVSRVYTLIRNLDGVTGYTYDDTTGELTWSVVENASYYVVSISVGGEVVYSGTLNNTSAVLSLKEYSGEIVVSVYAVANGYNSADPVEYKLSKSALQTPSDIKITGTVISWSAVSGAESYELTIGGVTLTTTETSYDVANAVTWTVADDYQLSIRAVSTSSTSLWSDEIDVRYLALYSTLTYSENTVSWRAVLGAEYYVVTVNDGEGVQVTDGSYSAAITLTQKGINTISVQFYDNGALSEAATIEVYAYAVTYNSNGGSDVETQYYAVGDVMSYPEEPTKTGYTFTDWYTTQAGPASNGLRFTEAYFSGSSELVLYAYYTAKQYTVVLYNGSTVFDTVTVTYGEYYSFAVPTTTDGTKSFGGYYTTSNALGDAYTDESGNSYAVWSLSEEDYVEDAEGNTQEYFTLYVFWQDDTLKYQLTTVNGVTAYAVAKGSKISSVTEVTIPQTYKGIPVLQIVTSAFSSATTLVTINIPDTIEIIGSDPFKSCSKLEAVNVYGTGTNGASATVLRYESYDGVLFDRGELQNVANTGDNYTLSLLYFPVAKTGSYTIPDKVTTIPTSAFASCKLSEIHIPATISEIGLTAFSSSANLTLIDFMEAEEGAEEVALTIGNRAFYNCDALETVTLPARLVSMGTGTFVWGTTSSTTNLTAVTYTVSNANVTFSFIGCDNLKSIYVAEGNEYYASSDDGTLLLSKGTYGYTVLVGLSTIEGELDLTKTTVGGKTNQLYAIGDGAFIHNVSITSLILPSSLATIGDAAFYMCGSSTAAGTGISTITFTGTNYEGLTIGKYAFRACYKLTSVVFEEGSNVVSLGEGAFYGCASSYTSGFKTITIPSSMSYVGDLAFGGCSYLTTVYMEGNDDPDYTLTFGENVFYNCTRLTTVYLPANVDSIPGIFNGCSALTEVIVDADNPYIISLDGAIYTYAKDSNGNFIYYDADGNESDSTNGYKVVREINYLTAGTADYDIPVGLKETSSTDDDGNKVKIYFEVTSLTIGLFRGLTGLTTINIPETVTSIGSYAFYGCTGLTSITIPASVTEIGGYAFYGCTGLTEVIFEEATDENAELRFTGEYVFRGCTSLTTLTLPAQTREIGEYFIYGCTNFVSIKLNEGLEEICDHGLYAYGVTNFLGDGDGTITIPSTVKSLGYYAIYGRKITGINFAKDADGNTAITTIGHYALFDTRITDISIPASVVSIGYYSMPLSVTTDSYGNVTSGTGFLTSITFEKYDDGTCSLTTIYPYAFAYQSYITGSLEIPKSVTDIGGYAFSHCSGLTAIIFEEGGTEAINIGVSLKYYLSSTSTSQSTGDAGYVFGNCTGLTSMTLPERTAMIGPYAFYYCQGLKEVDFEHTTDENGNNIYNCLSESYCYIEDHAFYYCSYLTTIHIPWYVTNTDGTDENARYAIDTYTFYQCARLTSVIFEQGGCGDNGNLPLTIANYAFDYCSALTEITFPARLAYITISGTQYQPFAGDNVFQYCNSLARVDVEEGGDVYASVDGIVYNYDKTELVYCPKARTGEIEIASTVTSIRSRAFYQCTGITALTFENSTAALESDGSNALVIGENAFYGCTGLTEIVFPTRLTEIGATAFQGCTNLISITLSKNLATFEQSMFTNCSKLTTIKVEEGSEYYSTDDSGVLFSSDGTQLILYITTITLTEYEVPEGVTEIVAGAFNGNTYIQKVTLPSGVMVIGDKAFYSCTSLTEINIPNTVYSIGDAAFYKCSSLKTVDFATGNDNNSLYIGSSSGTSTTGAFAYTNLSSAILPERTSVIGSYAFYHSNVRTLYIPASVTTINKYAFAYAEMLTSVEFAEGSTLTELPDYTFAYCFSLKSISLPDSITTLGGHMFYSSWNLKTVDLPASLTAIPTYLFSYCSSLESVEIPVNASLSTTYTATTAPFLHCRSLKTITFATDEDGTSGVTTIGAYAFYYCSGLESIELPESVTTINNCAFGYCYSLKTINLEKLTKLTTIGTSTGTTSTYAKTGAFYYCTSLESVTIPDSVTKLGTYDFAYCTALNYVKLPENSSYSTGTAYLFDHCSSLKTVDIPSTMTAFGTYMFQYSGLEEFTIPSQITALTAGLFQYCTELKSVTIHDKVTKFATSATSVAYTFRGCTALESVVIPDSVTITGTYVFYGCTALKDVTLPSNSTYKTIAADTFYNCSSLTSITIPSKVTALGNYAFYGTGLTSISLTDADTSMNITSLGTYAFANCVDLTSVTFSESSSFTSIGNYDFDGCTSLNNVVIPASVTSIGTYAFRNCSSLDTIDINSTAISLGNYAFYGTAFTSFVIPDSVTSLGTYVFANSTALKEVTLPSNSSVTAIPNYAFSGCTALTTVNIPENITSIGNYAFEGTALTSFAAGSQITEIGTYAFKDCTALTGVTLPSNSDYTIVNAGLFYGCTNLLSVSGLNRDSILTIAEYAFYGCSSLTSVELGSKLETIGKYAFSESGLTEVTVPGSVTGLSEGVFAYCTSLQEVTLRDGLETIGESAFWGCTSLTALTIPGTVTTITNNPFAGAAITEFVVEEGSYTVTNGVLYDQDGTLVAYPSGRTGSYTAAENASIGAYAFAGGNIETLTLSGNVTIGEYAFGASTIGTLDLSATTLTSIDSYLLAGATSITKVILPSTLTTIGSYAFAYSNIAEIEIPKSVTSIGKYAFYYTESLTNFTFEKGGTELLTIASYAFEYSGITTIEFPVRLRGYDNDSGSANYAIGQYAFAYSSIETVTFEEDSTFETEWYFNMDMYVFQYSSLKSIALPSYLGNLVYVTTSGSSTIGYSLYSYVFRGCESLESVTFSDDMPLTVTTTTETEDGTVTEEEDYTIKIGSYLFQNCTSLTSFTFPAQLQSMGTYMFDGAGLVEVTIPSTVTSTGTATARSYLFRNNVNLKKVTIESQSVAIGGSMFEGCTSLEEVIINTDTITGIGYYAFYGCTSLKSIVLPEGVTSIGYYAFSGCTSLESLTIPGTVTDILYAAFEDCTALTSITIPSSVVSLGMTSATSDSATTAISYANWDKYKVFSGWTSAQTIYIESTESTSAWVPSWKETDAKIVYLDATEDTSSGATEDTSMQAE